jgi:hypothetical protein
MQIKQYETKIIIHGINNKSRVRYISNNFHTNGLHTLKQMSTFI